MHGDTHKGTSPACAHAKTHSFATARQLFAVGASAGISARGGVENGRATGEGANADCLVSCRARINLSVARE